MVIYMNDFTNRERMGSRPLGMSKLLRQTPHPARHMDVDIVRMTPYGDCLYLAEETHYTNASTKITTWTKKLAKKQGVPSFLFAWVPSIEHDLDSIASHVAIRDLDSGQWLSPGGLQGDPHYFTAVEFTQWDSRWGRTESCLVA
jgi:hypothetical protein